MANRSINEKSEKDEKERDKTEEKSVEEKYRRDPLGAYTWGAILVWAGLVFLADNLGWLNNLTFVPLFPGIMQILRPGAWALVMLGAGLILLVEAAIRLLVPTYRTSVTGTLILAIIAISIGLGNLVTWAYIWPLILIVLGLSILLRGMRRKQ